MVILLFYFSLYEEGSIDSHFLNANLLLYMKSGSDSSWKHQVIFLNTEIENRLVVDRGAGQILSLARVSQYI